MRTLIRASQLHPDVSGLITGYTSKLYPNYTDIISASGLSSYKSGDFLVLGLKNGSSVSSINNLEGKLSIYGLNGLNVTQSGSGIYLNVTGLGTVGTLNGLSGNINLQASGIADVWAINSNTIAVKVPEITGINAVSVFHSGGKIYITTSSDSNVGTVNGLGQNVNIYGEHGSSIRVTGQSIYINSYDAAHSGVNSINGLKGAPIALTGSRDILITNNDLLKKITVNYIGSGWGDDYLLSNLSGKKNINWIGDLNFFDGDNKVFVQGTQNGFIENEQCGVLNGVKSTFLRCQDVAAINPHDSFISGISGTTLINPYFHNHIYQNNNSFMIGTPNINTFFNHSLFVAKISGFNVSNYNPIKLMKIPKSTQDSIFVATGSVLMGHLDYVAAAYHITDFYASSNVAENGMYGRKYFTIQRTNNLLINVRDQADLFGGSDKYNIILSGANNGRLYLVASGFSGHNVFFMGNMQYTQFSLNLIDE